MRALSSQIREPSSQHALSMTHNDLKCTKNHSLLLRLFACISLRIPWEGQLQGLIEFPTHDVARVPIQDRYQVHPACMQANVSNIYPPNMIGVRTGHVTQ